MKYRRNPLFTKILLYFLSLIILVFVMGLGTYIHSIRQMREEFSGKIMMNLQASANMIDNNLRSAQEISLNFFYDDTVQSHFKPVKDLTLQDKVYLSKIAGILSRNKSMLGNFIDNIFVFSDSEYVFTSDGSTDFNTFFEKVYRYDNMELGEWEKHLKSNKYLEILPLSRVQKNYGNNANVIPIVYTSIVNGYRMVMVLNISADTILKDIRKNMIIPSTEMMVFDSGGNSIIPNEEGDAGSKEIRKIQSDFGQKNSGSGTYSLNGRKGLVTFYRSSNYGWQYCLFTPMNEFEKQAQNVLALTGLFCLILAGIGVFFSFVFTARIYNPIRKISETLRENEDDGPVHQEEQHHVVDFALIDQSINSLKKQGAQFGKKQELLLDEFLDNSFMYLLNGNRTDQKEVLEKILRKQQGFSLRGYLCCNVLLEFTEAFYKDMQDVERVNILGSLKEVIAALMEEETKVYVVEYRQNLFACIMDACDREGEAAAEKAARKVIDCFRYDTRYCEVYAGIGRRCEDINDIAKSYADAATALANRYSNPGLQVIDSAKLSIENSIFYSVADEIKINNLLLAGDFENLQTLVEEIVNRNRNRGVSHEYMKILFQSLLHSGLRFLSGKNMDSSGFLSAEEHDVLEHDQRMAVDYSRTVQVLLEFFGRIIERTRQYGKDRGSDMALIIADYVERNYSKDLYLEKIADELGVSIKYLSRTFKCRMGMNLTDYISHIRVQKIKELLRTTEMSIGDISQNVGIFSRTTFVRTFRKFEGITPSEYRELCRSNPAD